MLDLVMKKVSKNRRRGIQWGLGERLEELNFADNIYFICPLAQSYTDIQTKLNSLQREAER